MSRSRNSPLEDDGKDGNGSNYQEGQTPERWAHDQRQSVLHHLRALPWQARHTHTDAEDRNCAVSLLLTKMSLIIPALPALCSPVTVLLQHPLSYIWKTSVPSESTFSLFPGPLTADKTLKHRLALHLGCIPLSPINVACQHLWSIPNGWWSRWKASSCTYAYVQSTCVSCVPPVF